MSWTLTMLLLQNNMLSKSSSAGLMNNSLNASLLAAAGIDARLLSQMNASYSQQPTKARESPKPKPEPETKESQAQRQAAAKLALRKQLEKTLLQVLIRSLSSLARREISSSILLSSRSHLQSLPRRKCISSRTLQTPSSST